MKVIPKIIYLTLTVLFTISLLPSCLNDDLSVCVAEKRVFFDYLPQTEREGVNPQDVKQLNLYIFDEDGRFMAEYRDKAPNLSPDYFMPIQGMPSGQYTFIAWANLGNTYELSSKSFVPGKTTKDEVEVFLNNISNGYVKEQLSPLFFATHANNEPFLEVQALVKEDFHLLLLGNIYRINVTVSGLGTDMLKEEFRLSISDNNARYRFDNTFAMSETFQYITPCVKEEEKLKGSLTVLRLTEDRKNPVLSVTIPERNNEIVVKDNLIEILLLAARKAERNLDFSRQHVFDIEYVIDPTAPMDYTIIIDNWIIIKQGDGELGNDYI